MIALDNIWFIDFIKPIFFFLGEIYFKLYNDVDYGIMYNDAFLALIQMYTSSATIYLLHERYNFVIAHNLHIE